MDSAGVGELPDADQYGDTGSNTLGNISRIVGGLDLPNLGKLGIGNIIPLSGVPATAKPTAAYGKMAEQSAGKDTTTGHWEMTGIILQQPFPTFPHAFPPQLIAQYEQLIGRKTLGNIVASGTFIIEQLGQQHMETGYPIVYTSADSVFQIAAHEEIISIEELYRFSQLSRDMLVGEYAVGRVIARPFIGQPGSFQRTERRHDYSLVPYQPTLLDITKAAGLEVMSVGKIKDIFAQK
jgi:phosphopentomutase